MVTIYDRQGNKYEMSSEEAEMATASGAYFDYPPNSERTLSDMKSTPKQPTAQNGLVLVYLIPNGTPMECFPVDAREHVRCGAASWEPLEDVEEGSGYVPPAPPENPMPEDPDHEEEEPNTREELMAALQSMGVSYRSNMPKNELHALWKANQ